MMTKLRVLMLVGCSLVAPSAFAIPVTIDIDVSGVGGGYWSLLGPTNAADAWFGDYSNSFDVTPGVYSWTIGGAGVGAVDWIFSLGGETISAGKASGTWQTLGFFAFDDRGRATSVPEPSTLTLFGIGLAALGFSRRRFSKKLS